MGMVIAIIVSVCCGAAMGIILGYIFGKADGILKMEPEVQARELLSPAEKQLIETLRNHKNDTGTGWV